MANHECLLSSKVSEEVGVTLVGLTVHRIYGNFFLIELIFNLRIDRSVDSIFKNANLNINKSILN